LLLWLQSSQEEESGKEEKEEITQFLHVAFSLKNPCIEKCGVFCRTSSLLPYGRGTPFGRTSRRNVKRKRQNDEGHKDTRTQRHMLAQNAKRKAQNLNAKCKTCLATLSKLEPKAETI